MKDVIVQTIYGQLCGKTEKRVNIFRGIPYAKPPVGERRFHPPQAPDCWEGVRDASSFGNRAIQPDMPISGLQEKSEDCLYLNVWTPKKGKSLPVMVWIHGGAFIMGSSSDPMYDGRVFAEKGNVIFVSMNYRLGIFGFMYLGELLGEKYATSGNNGLLDQIAALKWVKTNIEAFGGNPENITVFGESAGAVSVANLLIMPEAKGLFHKAIIESTCEPTMPLGKACGFAREIIKVLGISPNEATKLLEVPTDELFTASQKVATMSFSPVLDGVSISDVPYKLAEAGVARDIPVIIGANKDEYATFAAMDPSVNMWSAEEIRNTLEGMFRPIWYEMGDYYKDFPMDIDLYIRVMSYASFIYPTLKYTVSLSTKGKVWSYFFTWQHPNFKAGHGLEMPFVRLEAGKENTFQIKGRMEEKLSKRMFTAWVLFAKNGNPNGGSLPEWPLFDGNTRKTMIFDLESIIQSDPQKDRRLWDSMTSRECFKDVQLVMANDMFSMPDNDESQTDNTADLPQKEGYYSVHDKIGVLLKNKKTEAILYSMEDSFKSPDGKGMKLNKLMMDMVSKMTLVKMAGLIGSKFPAGLLEKINNELMQVRK